MAAGVVSGQDSGAARGLPPGADELAVPALRLGLLEELGLLVRRARRGGAYACPDRARLRLALLGLRIDLSRDELQELLALYDAEVPPRELSHFVGLLARYQRFLGARCATDIDEKKTDEETDA